MDKSRFELCAECGKHGAIFGQFGYHHAEISSIAIGEAHVRFLVDFNLISDEGAAKTLGQIRSSGLPAEPKDVEPETAHMVGNWVGSLDQRKLSVHKAWEKNRPIRERVQAILLDHGFEA